MRTYKLKVSDYVYPREIPVLIITTLAALIIVALVVIFNLAVGIILIVNIALLFFLLYQRSVSRKGYCVRVSPTQFPRIFQLAQLAADRLDMDMPPVYIQQSPEINAFADGFWGNYYSILTSAIVDGFTDEELLPIIGHEFTHIKANHVVRTSLTTTGVGLMKLVWWLQIIIKYIFMYLSRCQEYTCDRGAVIASGNIQSCITAFTKIAIGPQLFSKINIMEFYNQALELDRNPLSIVGEMESTHPYTVNRLRQLVRFYRSEKYRGIASMQGKMGTSTLQGSLATGDLMQKIVSKTNTQQSTVPQQGRNSSQYQQPTGFCKKCGTPKKAGSRFCLSCGTPYLPEFNGHRSADAKIDNAIPVIEIREKVNPYENTNFRAAAVESSQKNVNKICPKCGQNNHMGDVFCTECGERV